MDAAEPQKTWADHRAVMWMYVIGMLLALPVVLPFGVVSYLRHQSRLRDIARQTTCIACGGFLGVEALQIADERWHDHVEELQRLYPDRRWRLVRPYDAICPACGAEFLFHESTKTFSLVDHRAEDGEEA